MALSATAHILKRSSSGDSSIPYPKAVKDMMLSPESEQLRYHDGFFTTTAIKYYFGKGALTDYALDAVLHGAEEESSLGDGTFDEMYEEDDEFGLSQQWRSFPECANDLKFQLVRRKLGLVQDANGPHTNYLLD
jgi:hypothetical protein